MQISNIIKTFERDLKVKNYADNTISNYVSQVNKFLIYFQQKDSPKHISASDIKNYILTAHEVNSQRHMHSAIKLLYKYTIHQPEKFK
jgi:site-specific recombinase XerD